MCDYWVFIKNFGDNDFIILLLYLDNILIVSQDISKIDNLNKDLNKSFYNEGLGTNKTDSLHEDFQ